MKKRFSTFFAAALSLALLLSGCSHEAPEVSPTFTPVPTPTVDPHEGEIQVPSGIGDEMWWVPEAPDLAPFNYVSTQFNVVDQMPSYAGEGLTMLRGVDVSDHQQQIDWQAVADYGIDFAMIRCGWRSYSDPANVNEDSRFRENIEGALAAGLDVGVYFFSQALNIVEAAEEAVFTLHLIEDYNITLPVFFDWEPMPYDGSRTANVDGETVTACCLEFCRLVQAMGYQPGMYSYLKLAYYVYQLNELQGVSLWMGDPGTKPIFYYDHDFWQYTYTATVPGISVEVDMDAMYVRSDGSGGADAVTAPPATAVPGDGTGVIAVG